MSKPIVVTTPLFYPNNVPHLGTVHTMVLSDFVVRSFKVFGLKASLVTGTDEHGDKILRTAKERGLSPEVFLDGQVKFFEGIAKILDIEYDFFVRTTDRKHEENVKLFFKNIKDYVYFGKYTAYYSQKDEAFYAEEDLIDGKAPSGYEVELMSNNCYFLRSSYFKSQLEEFLNKNITEPENRVNELKGFIRKELKDLCISRERGWGIGIPGEENIFYVWFDALIGYLTAVGYPEKTFGDSRVIHVMAKEICIFHGVHWPVMLFAHGLEPFSKLLIHNWWNFKGEKMSKSVGNVVDPNEVIGKYGVSAVRFFLVKMNLISADAVFSEEDLVSCYNSFFINKFVNLVSRVETLVDIHKIKKLEQQPERMRKLKELLLDLKIQEYLDSLFFWCDELNGEIEKKQVWKNLEELPRIAAEVDSLIKLFGPIIPELKNRKRFERLKLN